MDKTWLLCAIKSRLNILLSRYNNYCNSKNIDGTPMTYGAAAKARYLAKRDIQTLYLLDELAQYYPYEEIDLSDEASEALDALLEPTERYNTIREQLKYEREH